MPLAELQDNSYGTIFTISHSTNGNIGYGSIIFHSDIATAKEVLKACYDGGARLMEFTNSDFAIEVFKLLIRYSQEELPGMILGPGSVTDGAASQYMLYGANFIVTPVYREDIAIVCNRRKVLWFRAVAHLRNWESRRMGCELVKLFPGSTYGPGFVAIKGPQPWTSIMPTGGVSTEESNLRGWFEAGDLCWDGLKTDQ